MSNSTIHAAIAHLQVKVAISKAPAQFQFNGAAFTGDGHEGSRLVLPAGTPWTCAASCLKPDVFMVVAEIDGKQVGVVLRNSSMDKLNAASTKEAKVQAKQIAKDAKAEAARQAKADAKAAKEAEAAQSDDAEEVSEPEVAETEDNDAGSEEGPSDGDLQEIEAAA